MNQLFHQTSVYSEGQTTSFKAEVIENNDRVFSAKCLKDYGSEQAALAASTMFWKDYQSRTRNQDEMREYLDSYQMEVSILGLIQ